MLCFTEGLFILHVKDLIKHLAKYLNLRMHQVSRHSEMLYEMDTKMLIMNKTIQDIMWSIDFL